MLDIGWSEMAVIAVVALIVIGPRDLPRLLYSAGKIAAKARGMLRELQQGIEDMGREAELEEIRKKVQAASSIDVEREIGRAVDPAGDLRQALDPNAPDAAAAERDAGALPPPAAPPPGGPPEEEAKPDAADPERKSPAP